MKDFEVLKDIFVSSGPPMILLKGTKVRLCYAHDNPVLGAIFEDLEKHTMITRSNWKEYLKLI